MHSYVPTWASDEDTTPQTSPTPTSTTTSKFPIEKGIPMPKRLGRNKYPWHAMEIGDSFLVTNLNRNSAHAAARKASESLGRVFKARQTSDGVRIWRVE